MKTKFTLSVVFTLLVSVMFAQNRTIVTANSADISDQLDLRAVATLFGESRNLEEFERNLNDPQLMISNLDLNGDNYVDYLRVIEHRQRNTHLVIIQAVLDRDYVQDVATIEVESNRRRRRAQVQIVGNPFIYGNNFIIEPVFAYRPIIYNYFWQPTYTLWVSPWSWGYYPMYFNAWHPLDMHFYYGHVNYWAGYHHFNYMNYRRFNRAVNMYNRHHSNAYANRYPNRSFVNRHQNHRNAHALHGSRGSGDYRQVSPREATAIIGRERVTNNRVDGGRSTNGRENMAISDRLSNGRENNTNGRLVDNSADRQSTSGREVTSGGRENNSTGGRDYQVGREAQSGREIQTGGRNTTATTKPNVGRETVNRRPVESNTRPVQSERNERTTVERQSTKPAVNSSSSRPERQVNATSETAPARVSTPARSTSNERSNSSSMSREQAPSRSATPAPSRTNEGTSSTSERSSRGGGRG